MKARRRAALAAVLTLALGGCNFWYETVPSPDDLMKLVPWFDHMITSPAFHPYERADIPRNTVPGTVPVDAEEMDWSAEWPASTATADRLVNPTDPIVTAAQGDTLYGIYCRHCHGDAGDARGAPVAPKIGAPSIVTERAIGLTDGQIYSIIRYGRGVMPRQGDRLTSVTGRWAVVNHVRALQQAATAGGNQ